MLHDLVCNTALCSDLDRASRSVRLSLLTKLRVRLHLEVHLHARAWSAPRSCVPSLAMSQAHLAAGLVLHYELEGGPLNLGLGLCHLLVRHLQLSAQSAKVLAF